MLTTFRRAGSILLGIVLALALLCPPAWGAATEIDTSSFITGAGRSVVLIGSTYYCCFTKATKLYMAHSTNGTSWTVFTGTAPTAVSGSAATIWTDGTSWYVAWYESTTKVYYATGSTSAYPAGTSIYTITAPGTYYAMAGCADASGIPHIVFGSGSNTISYGNKVSGSWSTMVTVVIGTSSAYAYIAIDTTSGHTGRYNLPQIVTQTSADLYAYLGNVNNATSFTSVNPQSVSDSQYIMSIAIDVNGVTSILHADPSNNLSCLYIAASGTWGTATAWTSEAIISDGYSYRGLSLAINGTTRYAFRGNGNTTYLEYFVSTTYGSWSGATVIESTAAYYPVVRWQYANNSYTNGIDFIFSAVSSGQGGIYWDNLVTLVSGTLAATASNCTASLSGSTLVATLAATASQITSIITGSTVVAALAANLTKVSASLSSTVVNFAAAISGSLANTVGALTGNHGVAGAIAATLSQVTASITGGIVDFTAQLSASLSQATSSLSGAHGVGATLSGVLSQVTGSLTGAHGVAASLSAELSQVTADLTGSIVNFAAAFSATAEQITGSLSSGHGIAASLGAALDQVSASFSAGHGVAATMMATIDQVTGSLSGAVVDFVASFNATMAPVSGVLSGAHGVAASLAGSLNQVTASLSATFTQNIQTIYAILSGNLAPISGSLAGGHGVAGVMAGILSPVTASIKAGHGVAAALNATVEQVTGNFTGWFHRILTQFFAILGIRPENRTLTLAAESRSLTQLFEGRALGMIFENRNLAIPAELRVLTVGAQ